MKELAQEYQANRGLFERLRITPEKRLVYNNPVDEQD